MAQFGETFLCTALPEGISGTKVRLAVLVSPRLSSDSATPAALSNWPDAVDWPAARPTWKVTIAQGATTVTLDATEAGAGTYDLAAWRALFPEQAPVTPYQPEDRSGAPIASYPVATVRDAVRDIHVEMLTNARTDFPAVEALQRNPTFQALKRAVNPDGVVFGQDPAADADVSVADAFAMVEQFHGARPGSEPRPAVRSLSPSTGPSAGGTLVTITGASLLGAGTVLFGNNPATAVTVTSSTSLTCRSPGGVEGTTVDVTVVGPGGTSLTSAAARFTYRTPAPTISVIDPRAIEGGTGTVTITGTNLEHTTAVHFGDKLATNIRIVSGTQLICDAPFVEQPLSPPPVNPVFNVRVDVTVTNAGGTSTSLPFTYWFLATPR